MKVYIGRYPGKRAKNQERKIRVRIDPHDVWGLDNTLAHIIHPALVLLREKKHGAPPTEDEDVPEELKSTSAPPVKDYETDDNWFKRWNWILDEMIWAFGQEIADPNWEDQFYSGEADIDWKEIDETLAGELLYEMVHGPNHTFQWDKEGHEAHFKRMQNGFRLFGKYYSALWD